MGKATFFDLLKFGENQVIIRNKKPEDKWPPICNHGPEMDLDECLFVPIELNILQYREIDPVELDEYLEKAKL